MKKYFALVVIISMVGCTMGREDMRERFHESTINAYKAMLENKLDSAMFFIGQQKAFYECIYNKKP